MLKSCLQERTALVFYGPRRRRSWRYFFGVCFLWDRLSEVRWGKARAGKGGEMTHRGISLMTCCTKEAIHSLPAWSIFRLKRCNDSLPLSWLHFFPLPHLPPLFSASFVTLSPSFLSPQRRLTLYSFFIYNFTLFWKFPCWVIIFQIKFSCYFFCQCLTLVIMLTLLVIISCLLALR